MLTLDEMQIASCRIWTQIALFISFEDIQNTSNTKFFQV